MLLGSDLKVTNFLIINTTKILLNKNYKKKKLIIILIKLNIILKIKKLLISKIIYIINNIF